MKSFYYSSVKNIKKKIFFTKWIEDLNDEIGCVYEDQKIFLFSSICPHFGGEFTYDLKHRTLRCKWHGWKFDALTGKSLVKFEDYESKTLFNRILKDDKKYNIGCFPFNGSLKLYKFKIENDQIYIVV